jgi:hypothetical protein
MGNRVISKLFEVDPAFREVVTALYGDAADPRELWDLSKSMPSPADMHVNGGMSTPKKKKAALAGGLIFGTVAEGHATAHAAQKAFPGAASKIAGKLAPIGEHIPKVKLPAQEQPAAEPGSRQEPVQGSRVTGVERQEVRTDSPWHEGWRTA